ncbi:MAG: tryptophan synthase subunit beta [Candidatus Gastranaerophilales bacterium]|nr:tryptophan synthase subunit beta [Candidatus Gastranaerophilales bacterium]
MKTYMENKISEQEGYFGIYGGQFIGDELKAEFDSIYEQFLKLKSDESFQKELADLLEHFSCRPTPVYFAKNLSKKAGCEIYLKREDLNHTGAHKINHSLGEALLAKRIGKTKVIAETGAGQHGVAIATAAALLGLECDIYMGEVDIKKAMPNVNRMKILGANVISVRHGQMTLKEAVDAAFEAYQREYKTALYTIGSVVGPHPFPTIVEYFQSVIGKESREQFLEMTGQLPDCVIACVGGGSNSIGMFDGFIDDKEVKIYGVEPLGKGEKIGENAASLTYGREGILHGFKCLLLQNEDNTVADAYSVASGLDYPGVGPKHCYLKDIGRVEYKTINDKEAIDAFYELSRTEGIIPALESSHAVAYGLKIAKENKGKKLLISLSGRGDKDIEFVLENYPRKF